MNAFTCQKCWIDAGHAMTVLTGFETQEERYGKIKTLRKQEGEDCTPAEHCGDAHLTLEFKSGRKICRCCYETGNKGVRGSCKHAIDQLPEDPFLDVTLCQITS